MTTARPWDGTITVSEDQRDERWDEFLASHPDGHHIQTASWARVKAETGWRSVRIVAESQGSIVGGAQIIHRRVGPLTDAGYIAMGPVLTTREPQLIERLLSEINDVARQRNLRAVIVQEPEPTLRRSSSLSGAEALGVVGQVVPRATVLIDVTKEPDEIRAEMKSRTRYNTKVGARKGVVITEGNESDVPAYHALVERTAQRQGFLPYPLSYFQEMWRAFDQMNAIRLTFAEIEGEKISAQLAITFGQTVVNKLSVWSGEHGSRRPNDALQWNTICWAHEQGYRWYDLEGIRPEAAAAILEGGDPAEATNDSVTSFKLGYGGQAVLRPEPFVIIPNPVLRFGFRQLYPRLAESRFVKKMLRRLRVTSSSRSQEDAELIGDRR